MKQVDFFYFFGSGYAYLSVMRIQALAKEVGVTVSWRPFNVRTVMAENNIALRTQTAKVKIHVARHRKTCLDRWGSLCEAANLADRP